MLKTAREKIALAVFVLLLLGGLGLCIAYISGIGHNLNVAASTIDDAAGELDGYSAFVYKGTVMPVEDSTTDSSTSHMLNQIAQTNDANMPTDETATKQLDEEELVEPDQRNHKEPLTLTQLRISYLDKGASCYELVVDNPHAYDAYTVVRIGKFSFGFISLHEGDTPEAVCARVKEYKQAEVDFIVGITPSLELLQSLDEQATEKRNAEDKQRDQEAAKQVTEGVAQETTDQNEKDYFDLADFSIVISTQDEGLLPGGVSVDGVFYDDAALTTELGTLLISPSKVITARDIAID